MVSNRISSARRGDARRLPSAVWAPLERTLERFEDAWRQGQRPDLDAYLAEAAGPAERRALLVELVHEDLEYRFQAGEAIRVEAYLQRYPELAQDREEVLQLIAAEFELRRGRESDLTPQGYLHRFPDYAPELAGRFQALPAGEEPAPAGLTQERKKEPAKATVIDPGVTVITPGSAPMIPPLSPGLPTIPGYEVLGELGRGGMGVVYKARQVQLNRIVALKMIRAGAHAEPGERARFKAEAEAVARLQHPNIVQIYEVGEADGWPFLSLEFVDGGALDRQINGKPLPIREAAALVERLARAVHAAHQRGIVHRDLKPANILLASGGREPPGATAPPGGSRPPLADLIPKIADFGLAKQLGAAEGPGAAVAIVGTPPYMAPEQALGEGEAVGAAADVYALGAILYELLTGRPLFEMASLAEMLLQTIGERPRPPRQLRPEVPPHLEAVCLQCLDKDPGRRPRTAAHLARALRGGQVLGRVEAELPAPGPLTRAIQRHPFGLLVVLAFLPHVLGSLVNISYNLQAIVRALTPEQQDAFTGLVFIYNAVVYPLCAWTLYRLLRPAWRLWGRLPRSPAPPGDLVTTVRRRLLTLPRWAVGLACLGWLPGGLLFPLALHYLTGPLGADVFGHFLLSFSLSGLIALTYSFFGVQYVVLRVLYPRLWVDTGTVQATVRREVGSLGRRLRWFQFWAGVIPLAGAVLMVGVGPEVSGDRAFRLLVTVLIVLGMAGFGVAVLVNGLLFQTLAVLTRSRVRSRANKAPGDGQGC
jgi:serine/threonine protein kinase